MKMELRQAPGVSGPAKMKLLQHDAAAALQEADKELKSVVLLKYTDMWRDPVAQLCATRLRPESPTLGYNGHGFGVSFDIDITSIRDQAHFDIVRSILRKHGWYCHRRDGAVLAVGAWHFDFLGPLAEKYLIESNFDPQTWNRPVQTFIYERWGDRFRLNVEEAQVCLSETGLFKGYATGELDFYTREALMAFQRTWRLPENGQADARTCRVLALVSSRVHILPA